MPFIPHTEQDVQEMFQTIGIASINALFSEIPDELRHVSFEQIPSGISEMELGRLMQERVKRDAQSLCFLGAGAYEHHIPAAVWDLTSRGEFYSAYTPYQPEASQGNLQLIYEYQTMMASLMGMEVSNASLYEGASALAEAVLMAVRLSGKNKTKILLPQTVHPHYQQTVKTIVSQQGIEMLSVPYDKATGKIDASALADLSSEEVAAIVIPQPNFFGILEDVDTLTDWAREKNILSIGLVNPLAMSLLKPPGQWGSEGTDIACGEGQALGIPLAAGGPYYGFLTCKKKHVRQIPGRVVGRTHDKEGKEGFVLTLQAREQHIRRAKATSNICTNQGLMVTASTIYMSLMGPLGLRHIAKLSHRNSVFLQTELLKIPGTEQVFPSPFFHEMVLRFPQSPSVILHSLAKEGIQAGYDLSKSYPELQNCLLLCVTETKSKEDILRFVSRMKAILTPESWQGEKAACQI